MYIYFNLDTKIFNTKYLHAKIFNYISEANISGSEGFKIQSMQY